MAMDLPAEIWLIILSLLPRGYCRRMMSLNRFLYNLGMDYLYQELRIHADDIHMLRTLDSLRYFRFSLHANDTPVMWQLNRIPDIARRVKHIYIRPTFVAAEEPLMHEPQDSKKPEKPLAQTLKRLRRALGHRTLRPVTQVSPHSRVIHAARIAFPHCTNATELTLVLHDLEIEPPFPAFLETALTAFTPRLRQLNLSMTKEKLHHFFRLLPGLCFPGLEDLHVHLTWSRLTFSDPQGSQTETFLASFVSSQKWTIRSLTMSLSTTRFDMSTFLKQIAHLPLLKTFAVEATLNTFTLSDMLAPLAFLHDHSATLEDLAICRSPGFNPPGAVDLAHETMLAHELQMLQLPVLRSLKLGIWLDPPVFFPLPLLAQNATQLTSFALLHSFLSFEEVGIVLDAFGNGCLRKLQLCVAVLSPELVDLLAAKLPELTHLDIMFLRVLPRDGLPLTNRFQFAAFRKQMTLRSYPDWKLRNLKIAMRWTSCGCGHVQSGCMKTIANCLPENVELLLEGDSCSCDNRQL